MLANPVIAIKNYKSQIPFPTQLVTLWTQIAELKDCSITGASLLGEPGAVFRNIISLDGFQLRIPAHGLIRPAELSHFDAIPRECSVQRSGTR